MNNPMSLAEEYTCRICGKKHPMQAFISHSSLDIRLVSRICHYCCHAGVSPFLYEMPTDVSAQASRQIVKELIKSSAFLALLGPEVSKRPWTQAWMAFEDGVFTTLRDQRSSAVYTIPAIFLIEDISQSSDAAMPFLEVALLLDFSDIESWPAVKTVLSLLNPAILLNRELLGAINRLRLENLIVLKFQCPCPKCKSNYEILIWIGPRARRKTGIPNPPRRFSIKCSVCRSLVNVQLKQSQSGPPDWNTVTHQPRSNSLPLTHISRLV